jgi:hypothetical protein
MAELSQWAVFGLEGLWFEYQCKKENVFSICLFFVRDFEN